jgi:hypothetical protein
MTLQLHHSEFPYIRGKFHLFFYQCGCIVLLSATLTGLPRNRPLIILQGVLIFDCGIVIYIVEKSFFVYGLKNL